MHVSEDGYEISNPYQTRVSPQIVKALFAVMRVRPTLGKDSENKFQHYNYVSIDAYYEAIPALAVASGLFWSISEQSCEAIGNTVRNRYSFDLFHEEGDHCPNFALVTIVHPVQGAQTAMSAAAYAEKWFMRTLFKVPTGEQDADATDQGLVTIADYGPPDIADDETPMNGKLPTYDAPGDPSQWPKVTGMIVNTITLFCESVADLKEFKAINTSVLTRMKKDAADEYEMVKAAFTERANQLKMKGLA